MARLAEERPAISRPHDSLARKISAGSDGAFAVTSCRQEPINIVVNKSGFSEARADKIEVRVTETTRVTIPLKPGQVNERVEISAQVTTVETTNATTGESIGTATVRELPLAPRITSTALPFFWNNANSTLPPSWAAETCVSSSTARRDNNNYLIEGISSTDYNVSQSPTFLCPTPTSFRNSKFKPLFNDASQGRNAGERQRYSALRLPRVLHGDIYEYFRIRAERQRIFPQRRQSATPPGEAEYFLAPVSVDPWALKIRFFLCELSGTRQRKRPFSRHAN